MVRLLQGYAESNAQSASSFNPTMVRLLHNDVMRRSILLAVFQSHNGAIATGVI